LIFRIRLVNELSKKKKIANTLDQSDEIFILKNFQDTLLNGVVLRGVNKIEKVIPRKVQNMVFKEDGKYIRKDCWVLDTTGTNLLNVIGLDYIDSMRTYSNDIREVYDILGVEAARQVLFNEISEVMEHADAYINYHHLSILCDRMTTNDGMTSIFRHGINNDDIGPIAKASFEETPEMFLRAAKHAELETMRGISANVMCGQEGYYGTGMFQVMLDMNKVNELNEINDMSFMEDRDDMIEKSFNIENPSDVCSVSRMTIENNVRNIKTVDLGKDDDYNPGF